jgi:hypothetical protein
LGSRFQIPLDFRTPVALRLAIEELAGESERGVAVVGPFDRDVDVGSIEFPGTASAERHAPARAHGSGEGQRIESESREAITNRDVGKFIEKTVRGKVVGEGGAPIAEGMVEVRGFSWCNTDVGGSFELGPWLPARLDLRLTARAHLPVSLSDIDVDSIDGRTFVMRRGRSVRLTVVDDRGEPFVRPNHVGRCDHGWETWITVPGTDLLFSPDDGLPPMAARGFGHPESPAGPGVYDFLGLPDGVVKISVEGVEGPVYTLDHDSSVPDAQIVVPSHGSIRLSLDTELDERRMRVHVEPTRAGGTALQFIDTTMPYYGTLLLPAVLPGDYIVRFERPADPAVRTWRPFGGPARITVWSGDTTLVMVGR